MSVPDSSGKHSNFLITQSQSQRHWLALQCLLWLVALISRNEEAISGKITQKTHMYTHSSNTHMTQTTHSYHVLSWKNKPKGKKVERSTVLLWTLLWHWLPSVGQSQWLWGVRCLVRATMQHTTIGCHLCIEGGQKGQRKRDKTEDQLLIRNHAFTVICVPLSKCLFSNQWSWLNWSAKKG